MILSSAFNGIATDVDLLRIIWTLMVSCLPEYRL